MTSIDVGEGQLPIRTELAMVVEDAWRRLTQPGTWWGGAQRRAIAAEARNTRNCGLCRRRKDALSPYTVDGSHDDLGELHDDVVEAIHRLASDAGRITERWVREITSSAVSEEGYVEIISIVAIITALDTFDHALGRPQRPLPAAQPGEPGRQRPKGAKRNLAWVSTLAPEDVEPSDPNPYPIHGVSNIHRALSLVPQEVFNFFDLDVELYLGKEEFFDHEHEHRAISRAQIELVAGRASAINGCFY